MNRVHHDNISRKLISVLFGTQTRGAVQFVQFVLYYSAGFDMQLASICKWSKCVNAEMQAISERPARSSRGCV